MHIPHELQTIILTSLTDEIQQRNKRKILHKKRYVNDYKLFKQINVSIILTIHADLRIYTKKKQCERIISKSKEI